jgi:hypothetical protein
MRSGVRPRRSPPAGSWGCWLALLLLVLSLAPLPWPAPANLAPALVAPALAGPVDWQEVPASPAGRQWWDAGSLRRDRRGRLSVLSRFQPAEAAPVEAGAAKPARAGTLYVMELDCEQELYRDVSVNGIPRWGATWSLTGGDPLTTATLRAACAAAPPPRG